MKNSLKITFAVMIAAGGVLIQSCQKEDQPNLNTNTTLASDKANSLGKPVFYGPTVPVGQGTARAWVRQNDEGDPVEVGIDLSEKALQNLPDENASWVLLFPQTKGKNFYTHMLVDWNPHGHVPVGVYDLPHFDFHFYWISNEERLSIPAVNPPYLDPAPASKYIPATYIETPGIVPQMGVHWVNVTSPEFHGIPFTKTFIWGSYQGEFIFFEPMITRAYLLGNPNDEINLIQPSAFQQSGWYPQKYRIESLQNPDKYTITLSDLTYHEGE